ncbi:MAG: trypsin-like peptidase domain-containing protein, partial [Myxococcota bacterium]
MLSLSTGCASASAASAPASVQPSPAPPERAADVATHAPVADVLALESALQNAAETVAASVVSITSKRQVESGLPAFMRPPGDDGVLRGVGSGVIIDKRGYVLTNNHVVEGATELVVRLDDDRELDAVVVGRDPKTDLAVIEIEADGLRAAALANSDDLRVGQWVMAAGSPFGLPRTVTAG